MTDSSAQFDNYLDLEGPAALVVREHLIPVEGRDGVFFPSTFADIGYNIDYENPKEKSGRNIALIDSVGSQANRIEPMFAEAEYADLIPQITIKAGEKTVNLLDAGHRAGDAIVRCSELKKELQDAFKEVLKGNAIPIAHIAPTSLVFGVWDSRDTQAKLPRLISSTIRAYNVRKLTRSAQYWAGASSNPVTIYDNEAVLGPIKDKKDLDARSAAGYTHIPSTGGHGGVIADGGIRRDAVLALSALKLLKAGDEEETRKLQRYILGLALVAFTRLPLGYYRQGTILVLDPDSKKDFSAVGLDGKKTPCTISHDAALAYAQKVAKDFGVGQSRNVEFDKNMAKEDIKAGKKK